MSAATKDREVTRHLVVGRRRIPVHEAELWTAGQRQANPIHEVSYRACFKPQLPAYFINAFTKPGQVVYDPFSGRGTTAIESALMGRRVIANDVNPLSALMIRPRLHPVSIATLKERLGAIRLGRGGTGAIDLSMFYHDRTAQELNALRRYLLRRREEGVEDTVDRWIGMVATNRLTGHSPGFFSVRTLPPNQAVSAESQILINRRLKQTPEYRDVKSLILKKCVQLQSGLSLMDRINLKTAAETAKLLSGPARRTPSIKSDTVDLIVTSPPFLDVVQYARDNWLRCWFNGIDASRVEKQMVIARRVEDWSYEMGRVMKELARVLKPGGVMAFEVGEVRNGSVRLEEIVAPIGIEAGLKCQAVLINTQKFTKTANIWGVGNNKAGTNTNRILIFRKPG